MLHTAHIWDWTPFEINWDVAEEAYFYKIAKPSEGIWACWVPKDEMDWELW